MAVSRFTAREKGVRAIAGVFEAMQWKWQDEPGGPLYVPTAAQVAEALNRLRDWAEPDHSVTTSGRLWVDASESDESPFAIEYGISWERS